MSSQHTQANPKTQQPHSHGAGASHTHDSHGGHGGHGMRLMNMLGLARFLAHNTDWMSDYRNTKLIPASTRVLVGTILVLVLGVMLYHMLPLGINNVGLALAVAALAHLALLVAGGLTVSLFVRHQRETSRQVVINSIPWKGSENVLDVGCGTGMLLNGCARKLTTGKAIGIDLWQETISGTPEVLLKNAQAEGVADKITFKSMDGRHLAFEDGKFNVVVSSYALHHIGTETADRDQAVSEMVRVLAPGGYLSVIDVGPMIDIAESVIARSGLQVVTKAKTSFFHQVTARKA